MHRPSPVRKSPRVMISPIIKNPPYIYRMCRNPDQYPDQEPPKAAISPAAALQLWDLIDYGL